MSGRTWIGLDPSISAFGYAVMRQELGGQPFVLDIGTWKTRIDDRAGKLEDRARRVRELGAKLKALLYDRQPSAVYVESLALGMKTGRGTVQTLGRIRGLVEGLCIGFSFELSEVRPEVLKEVVAGQKSASKEQVARVVMRLYPEPKVFEADTNATDALAVAHVGAYRGGCGVTVSSGVVSFRRDVDEEFEVL